MQLIEEFTLREMIEFHFKFKILRPGVSVGDVVDKIELRHASNEFIGNFSSGMRQRVKLALAFYAETDLLFLDEPTTNLDKNSVNWYLAHLEESVQRRSVFIASNQEREYPEEAVKIDLTTIK
jgi:ABC-type multidrug transport system ATPase subunit